VRGARRTVVRGPSTMALGPRPLAAVLVLILAALATGGPCRAKEAAIQALARGDDGRVSGDGLVALLATAMLACGAADSELLLAMGSVLYGRGDSTGALRCWRAGWRLSPLSVGLANNVAAALIDLSRPVDAIAALRVLEHRLFLARQPATVADWWKTDMNMASAMAELDDLRGSAGRLQRALAHPAFTDSNPQKPVAAANLIYTRRRLCEWKAFESDVQMAAQLIRRQLTGAFDFLLPGALPVDPFMALTFLPPGPRRSDGDGSIGPEQVLAATYRYARGWHVPEAVHLTDCRASGFSMPGGGALAGWSAGAGRRGERPKFVVGYVCSEFGRRHSVMLLMRAVFERHNRATVRVLCFSTRPLPHSSTDRPGSSPREHDAPEGAGGLEGCAEALELGGGGDASQAAVINSKLPHVLVDLNGWTAGHAMGALAYRPSPIIVNYMGFAGSTGADFVDFAAFDPVAAPPEHAGHFSERLLLLPHSYFVTDFLRADFSAAGAPRSRGVGTLGAGGAWDVVVEEGRRMRANYQSDTRSEVGEEEEGAQDILEAEGLERHAVRVCNHDQGYKLDPYRFASWCRVLQPRSGTRHRWKEGEGAHVSPQLWLLGQGAEVDGARSVAAPAACSSRIVFARKTPVRAHMRRIRLCHLALDTSPIGAHTTAANYLWARVPVATLPGQHVMSRVAASLLLALARDRGARSACASATIVRSEDDYVAVARALARGAGAAEAGEEAWTRRDETPRSSAVLDAYAGIRECLRAATEPLDARLGLQARKAEMEEKPRGQDEGRSDRGGRAEFASDTGSSFTGHPRSRAASPVVFDTARWVRDWERALMLAVDLSVGTDTGLSAGAGAPEASGFSLVVCSRLL
jgi:predicted O-linked N-acetylglucosamine transferase (SPINDLY family)